MELTSYQAWFIGFTTGVVACIKEDNSRLNIEEFIEYLTSGKLNDLTVVHNIGSDETNGVWAMAGARMGTYLVMLTNWDHTLLEDTATIDALWESVESRGADMLFGSVAEQLSNELGLPMLNLDADTSKFFKYHLDAKQLYPAQT